MKQKDLFTAALTVAVAAVVVLGVHMGTANLAAQNAQAELDNTIAFLLPESKTFSPEAYDGTDEAIQAVYKGETGYVVQTKVDGYAGDIVLLVGVDNDGTVTGLTVRQMEETWGLGARALTDADFLIQFLGTDGSAEVGSDIDALTGATVTSKAVARGVNAAVGFVTGADTSSSATTWGG